MKRKLSYLSTLTAIGLALAAGPAPAQTATAPDGNRTAEATASTESGGGANTADTQNAGAFSALSPGGQKITRALFDAQKQPAADGSAGGTNGTDGAAANGDGATPQPAPLSLDDIAQAKSAGAGWGQVFKEMKAEGLVAEKNLGQVISGANHRNRTAAGNGTATGGTGTDAGTGGATATAAGAAPVTPSSGHRHKPVTVTLANGATVVVGDNGQGRGHALRGDAVASAVKAGDGMNRGRREISDAAGGHGPKHGVVTGATGQDFAVTPGGGAAGGNAHHGSFALPAGVSAGGGHGSTKGRGR